MFKEFELIEYMEMPERSSRERAPGNMATPNTRKNLDFLYFFSCSKTGQYFACFFS